MVAPQGAQIRNDRTSTSFVQILTDQSAEAREWKLEISAHFLPFLSQLMPLVQFLFAFVVLFVLIMILHTTCHFA